MSCPAVDPAVVVDCDIFTVFGGGMDAAWKPLLEGVHGFTPCRRFQNPCFESMYGAFAPDLAEEKDIPGFFLDYLAPVAKKYPNTAEVFLAATVGEIEQVENPLDLCTCDSLLQRTLSVFGKRSGRVISAACASSNAAVARAERLLQQGLLDYAIVLATDYISEFVFSGFASIHAMSESSLVRPYDKNRNGLLLGDAAGIAVLTRRSVAEKEHLPILATVSGSGMSSDAVHITAPDPEGKALQSAIRKALKRAGRTISDIGAVIGHGTGTVYNDAMEIHALQAMGDSTLPLFSVKGSSGHTLAGAGLIQLAAAVKMFEERVIPPQTSLETPEDGGETMLSKVIRPLKKQCILSMNSGFGGMNTVLLLEGGEK